MKKIHRFIGKVEINGVIARLEDEEVAHHLKTVLRIQLGEVITLCDGKGSAWTGPLQGVSKQEIEIEIQQTYHGEEGLFRDVTMYLAILKSEHFDLAVQKAVECGVKTIIPIITKRTIKLQIKPERIEHIIREASEQSGRMFLPSLLKIQTFQEAVEQWKASGESGIFFDGSGKSNILHDIKTKVSFFIGPEGGWEDSEIETAKKEGLHICQLGNLILRSETAAIIASYTLAQQK
ncbi:16S rRNA (uracil(1498)-N(3))-methyltransferase [Candidatus Uhrbacteria bacterium]|nr:16S rRNA (uracil(1498)-N(3))-methyltransferase [Candidatus Uhrbacteria bacterium]